MGADRRPDLGIIILAGGEARRLPGKLELPTGDDRTILSAVYENMRAVDARELYLSVRAARPPAFVTGCVAKVVVDRFPGTGPIGGLLSVLPSMRVRDVFVVAGDSPRIDARVVDCLVAIRASARVAGNPGDAHVPVTSRDARLQPLAALYDRRALTVAVRRVYDVGDRSLRAVLALLDLRCVTVSPELGDRFTNINTPADYATYRAAFPGDLDDPHP